MHAKKQTIRYMRTCKNCGFVVEDDNATVCEECGITLPSEPDNVKHTHRHQKPMIQPEPEVFVPEQQEDEQETEEGTNWYALACVVGVIALISVLVCARLGMLHFDFGSDEVLATDTTAIAVTDSTSVQADDLTEKKDSLVEKTEVEEDVKDVDDETEDSVEADEFQSEKDVIKWLKNKHYYVDVDTLSMLLEFREEGVYVDDARVAGTPHVTSFTPTKANVVVGKYHLVIDRNTQIVTATGSGNSAN